MLGFIGHDLPKCAVQQIRWTRAAGACFSTNLVRRRGCFDSRRRVNSTVMSLQPNSDKAKFLADVAFGIALAGTAQRGKVYRRESSADERKNFRSALRRALENLAQQYDTPALSVISVSLSITSIEKSKSSSMPPFAVAFATCSLVRASPVPTSEITTDLPSVNALPAHGTITNHSSCLETFCRTKSRLSITAEYLPAARPVSLRYLANVTARAGSVGASVS